ncbi:hypothetical protein BH23PLA1_BH23PLA1_10940 [soil metagenome]
MERAGQEVTGPIWGIFSIVVERFATLLKLWVVLRPAKESGRPL